MMNGALPLPVGALLLNQNTGACPGAGVVA